MRSRNLPSLKNITFYGQVQRGVLTLLSFLLSLSTRHHSVSQVSTCFYVPAISARRDGDGRRRLCYRKSVVFVSSSQSLFENQAINISSHHGSGGQL